MQELVLDSYIVVRVWLADFPPVRYPKVDVLAWSINQLTRSGLGTCQCVLEFFIPTLEPSSYGLLGAKFTPDETAQLKIEVVISTDTGESLEWSLGTKRDRVYAGLPAQYAKAVLDGARGAAETPMLGSGTLLFDCAAHGFMRSSQLVFRNLARAIVWLLSSQRAEAELELLKKGLAERLM